MNIYRVNYKEISMIEIIGFYIAGALIMFISFGLFLQKHLFFGFFVLIFAGCLIYLGHRKKQNKSIFKEGFLFDISNNKFIYPNEEVGQQDEVKISSIYSIQKENKVEKQFNVFLLILFLFMPSIGGDSNADWVYILHIHSKEKEKTLSFKFTDISNRDHLFDMIAKLANLS